MARAPVTTSAPTPSASCGSVTVRLVHALDLVRASGGGRTPSLEPAVRGYVAACRAGAMPLDAVLAALDAVVQMHGCRRGPGCVTGALSARVAGCGREAYLGPV